MKVLGCASLPIVIIKMIIESMQNDSSGVTVYEKQEGETKPFWVLVPKPVAKKLAVGNTITVACVPVNDLGFAAETLALKIHTSERSSQILFDRANYSKLIELGS